MNASEDSRIHAMEGDAPQTKRAFLVILVAIGFAARFIPVAFLPIRALVSYVTPDDAFYYFTIARNITTGRGVTFDGEVTTNGFHPLWMAVVTACYAVPIPWIDPIRVSLAVSAAIATLGIVPLFWIVEGLTGERRIAIAVGAVYAVHPSIVLQSVNGLETGLALTALLFCLDSFRGRLQDPSSSIWPLGAAGGVLILSRTDYALFFAAVLLFVAWRRSSSEAARAGLLATAITTPWFVWSMFAVGSPFQSSGEAVPVIAHGSGPVGFGAVAHGLGLVRTAWTSDIPRFYLVSPSLRWFGVAALIALALAVLGVVVRRRFGPAVCVILALSVGAVLLTVVHAGVRWYFRDWYLPAIIPLILITSAIVFSSFPERRTCLRAIAGAAFAAAFAGSMTTFGWHAFTTPRYEIQRDMLAGALWSRENTPDDAIIGSFNAGIVGYYSGRQTVNLDGVVDAQALEAVRDRELLGYIDRRCVTHLADFPFYLFWYQAYWGGDGVSDLVKPVASFAEATARQPSAIAAGFTVWEYAPVDACRAG